MKIFIASVISVGMAIAGLVSTGAFSAEHDGVQMADQITVGGKKLVLNGMGTREATVFNVRVYVAGLYLQTPSHDASQILSSKEAKKLVMLFTRDVEAGKIREAFQEGFRKNCAPDCAALEPDLAKLIAKMPDMKNGETMSFIFDRGALTGTISGREVIRVTDPRFLRPFLAIWIGSAPPNESLKKGLLSNK